MERDDVRKRATTIGRRFHAGGPRRDAPHFKGATLALLHNPFAGWFADGDPLIAWMEALRPLAAEMAEELVRTLGGADRIETFGKGAFVGAMREIEHAAIWHAPGGAAGRRGARREGAKAQAPSSKKNSSMGARRDIPLHNVCASMVRSHDDVAAAAAPDGPKPAEIVFALVMSTGARVHARLGGLSVDDAVGDNGLN